MLPCIYKDRIPSTEELLQLKVRAFAPSSACASCGDVKAYHAGVIDEETIFEYQGRYYKNVVSLVHVAGKSFRNPPLFGFTETPSTRSAMWEVESLLEHLVTHPNTAPFVSLRLIQRLVSSNPSSDYVRDVSEAFRTGRYGDQVFSGRHGDLAAAVAAAPRTHLGLSLRRYAGLRMVGRLLAGAPPPGGQLLQSEPRDLAGALPSHLSMGSFRADALRSQLRSPW